MKFETTQGINPWMAIYRNSLILPLKPTVGSSVQ